MTHSCVGPQNADPVCPCKMAKLDDLNHHSLQQRQIAKAESPTFRCHLCDYQFQRGDGWRWINAQGAADNFITCDACDGPDVVERRKTRQPT